MQAEDEVRAASNKLYAALNRMLNGDAGSLTDIWSHGASVTTMHPIGGREVGWEQVTSAGRVELSDQLIQVAGDTAYELAVEHARFTLAGQPVAGDCRVTNIYRRESAGWKIVHHHTDATPALLDVFSRLKK